MNGLRKACPFLTITTKNPISQDPAIAAAPCIADKCVLWTKGSFKDGLDVEDCAFKVTSVIAAYIGNHLMGGDTK